LRVNAEKYGIDAENVALWGDSSGGHTVLIAGITGDGLLDTEDYNQYSCKVNSIVNFYGPTDVAKMCEYPSIMDHSTADSPEGYLIGKVPVLENLDLVKAACPATYVSADKDCPPVLTIHGDSDRIVPFEQSIVIHEALVKAGKYSEFYKLVGADHGSGEFWADETYDIIEAFIRRHNAP
jgi:acetyl esterase/lipase